MIHAAGQSARSGPVPEGTFAVALTVPDEAALRALSATLDRSGVDHVLVIEEDAPYASQAMALGIPPGDRKLLKPYLSRYPLLK